MESVFVTGIVCLTFYKVLELYARRAERIKFIERMSAENLKPNGDPVHYINFGQKNHNLLRIAGLMTGIGFGLLFAYITFLIIMYQTGERNGDALFFSSIMLFGGLGLIIAHCIERKEQNKANSQSSQESK